MFGQKKFEGPRTRGVKNIIYIRNTIIYDFVKVLNDMASHTSQLMIMIKNVNKEKNYLRIKSEILKKNLETKKSYFMY